MTISSTQSKVAYAGNGSTVEFAVPFMFIREDDIEVIISTDSDEYIQTISTDYNLSGAGDQSGGVCTMTVAPQTGESLVVRRNPSLVQEVDYMENDPFPAATHEGALDKLTMICQALSERLDRTITFRVSSAVSGVEVPDPEAGKILSWNAEGDNLANRDGAALGVVGLPLSIAEGGTAGTTIDESLSNLGFGGMGKTIIQTDTNLEALAALDAEPADNAILKSDMPDILQAVYGDEAQEIVTHAQLYNVNITRNHLLWTMDTSSFISFSNEAVFPYDGTYVFHIYPTNIYEIRIGSEYKLPSHYVEPDPDAGEIRIVVEVFNGRKSIVSIQNMEV